MTGAGFRRHAARVLIAVMLAHMSAGPWATATAAQASGAATLRTARDHYARAEFSEAVALLEPLAADPALASPERIGALETLALSYINMGDRIRGKDAFKRLLQEDPEWKPDPLTVSPPQIEVFDEALVEHQQSRKPPSFLGRMPVWLKVAGGGFLALGAALLVAGSGESPGPPLPEPPDVP